VVEMLDRSATWNGGKRFLLLTLNGTLSSTHRGRDLELIDQAAAAALDFVRKRAGGDPNSRLKARLNAGSDS